MKRYTASPPCPRLKTSLVQSKLPTPGVEWCIQVSMFIRASPAFSQGKWNTDEMRMDVLLIVVVVLCYLYFLFLFGCTQHDNYSTCAAAESKNFSVVVVVSTEPSAAFTPLTASSCVFYSSSSLSSSLVFLSLLMLNKRIRSCSGFFFLLNVPCRVVTQSYCCCCARKELRYSPGETQKQDKTKALASNQSS